MPNPDGGTHEQGLRAALTKGLRAFGDLVGQKKAKDISADDVMTGAEIMLSVFIREPQFQSQTKDRLTSPEAARMQHAAEYREHHEPEQHQQCDAQYEGQVFAIEHDRASEQSGADRDADDQEVPGP